MRAIASFDLDAPPENGTVDRSFQCSSGRPDESRLARSWSPKRASRECGAAAPRPQNCPRDATNQRLSSQRQPTRLICEVEEREGFTRKTEDGREADFRLGNRRLRRLGRLTAANP